MSIFLCWSSLAVSVQSCPPYRSWIGSQYGGALGNAVCGLGDISGDGVPDFAIAEGGYNLPNAADAGRVRVRSGASNATLWLWNGTVTEQTFGRSVAAAGDVNGDGVMDVVIGAWFESVPGVVHAGAAYVYSGGSGQLLWRWQGAVPDGGFGASVSNAGDVDGDGHQDVIIGAPGLNSSNPDTHAAFIYSGSTGQLLRMLSSRDTNDKFGISVAPLNGPYGEPFVLVGASWADGVGGDVCGKAYIYNASSGKAMATLDGDAPLVVFGQAVGAVDDVNDDGVDDFFVTSYYQSTDLLQECGRVTMFSGATYEPLWVRNGYQTQEFMGYTGAPAGDVNGDGIGDVIVGAYGASGTNGPLCGHAYLFSGRDGSLIHYFEGTIPLGGFSLSVAGVGDINRDGFDDVMVGAPWNNASVADGGAAYLFRGAPSADMTCDVVVNLMDLIIVIQNWGDCEDPILDCPGDVNGDAIVNIDDLVLVITNWGL